MREKERSSNFELLRIISMVLIILSHYVAHGGLLMQGISLNQSIAQLLKLGGKLGVTCFVLVSGYFLVDSKFKVKNIVKLNIQIIYYAAISLIVLYLVQGSVGVMQIVKSLFAPIYGIYWYPTAYLGLYLCFPVLNLVVNAAKDKLKNIVICMFFTLSVINFVIPQSNFLYSNIAWFVFLYFVGAYFKKNQDTYFDQKAGWLFLLNILIMWSSSMILVLAGSRYHIKSLAEKAYYFSNMNSPFMFAAGLSMFLIFKNMKCGQSKGINAVAASTFAVYLCHDNDFVREIIWSKILHTQDYFHSSLWILMAHMMFSVVVFFAAAFVLEIPRRWITRKILNHKLITEKSAEIDQWYRFDGAAV